MWTNKANNGQRRNYSEVMSVNTSTNVVAVDCPACNRGGARVRIGQATADCYNCGALITIKWRKATDKKG